jgi:hypothetical protein
VRGEQKERERLMPPPFRIEGLAALRLTSMLPLPPHPHPCCCSVAVKTLSKLKYAEEQDHTDMMTEADLMWRVRGHANVVEMYDYYEDRGAFWIVCELCEAEAAAAAGAGLGARPPLLPLPTPPLLLPLLLLFLLLLLLQARAAS